MFHDYFSSDDKHGRAHRALRSKFPEVGQNRTPDLSEIDQTSFEHKADPGRAIWPQLPDVQPKSVEIGRGLPTPARFDLLWAASAKNQPNSSRIRLNWFEIWPDFNRAWPSLVKFDANLAASGPKLAQSRTSLGQVRSMMDEIRPNSAGNRQDVARCRLEMGRLARMRPNLGNALAWNDVSSGTRMLGNAADTEGAPPLKRPSFGRGRPKVGRSRPCFVEFGQIQPQVRRSRPDVAVVG